MMSIMPQPPDPNDEHNNDLAYARDNLAWIGSKLDPNVDVDHSRPGDVGAGAWKWLAENMFHDVNNTPGLDEADALERMLLQGQHNYFGSESHQGTLIEPGNVRLELDSSKFNNKYYHPYKYSKPTGTNTIQTRPGFSNWSRTAEKDNPDK